MFLKRGAEVGNGGITEHNGDLRNAEAFFIQQVTGMLHALALVEIENGGAKELFEPLFEVAFVNG